MNPAIYFSRFWKLLRQVTGDDAYERYLAHHASSHGTSTRQQGSSPGPAPCGEAPLTRQQYFKRQQEEKWSRVSRCC